MANGNVRNAPGISFIEFDEKNEDKVVRWRDYLSELKAYDYILLVKNLLKRKKVEVSPWRRRTRQHHAAVQFGECFIRLRREEYCA